MLCDEILKRKDHWVNFVRQQFKMNENNEILHYKEKEDSNKDQNHKQAAEPQQPSPPPNLKPHISKKNKQRIENAVSIASVMEEIHREVETDTPS